MVKSCPSFNCVNRYTATMRKEDKLHVIVTFLLNYTKKINMFCFRKIMNLSAFCSFVKFTLTGHACPDSGAYGLLLQQTTLGYGGDGNKT